MHTSATSEETPDFRPVLRPQSTPFNCFAWFVHRVAWRTRLFEYALPLIERELRSTVRVPLWKRPVMWRRGFLGESHVLYDFERYDRAAYLTDYERAVRSRTINGAYGILLDDKLLFARLMNQFAAYTPQLFGILRSGRVSGADEIDLGGATLTGVVDTVGKVVVKPTTGGGGKGIAILECRGPNSYLRDGRPVTADEIKAFAQHAEGCMVTGFAHQHREIADLSPATTNTVRIVTMQDEANNPFIACAVLRIGCARSAPVDNWSNGGLSASIDIETGIVGPAATYPAGSGQLAWHTTHPESGSPIAGITLPNWHHVMTGILVIARSLPFLRYVGWDVVVTGDSFSVIEGNNFTDVNLLQIHGPLLNSPLIAAFYRRHGVLGKRPRP